GVKSLPYEDFVREALCFGWIDSLVKRLDDDRFAIKVTPRKPASKWSDINRRRWMELKSAALLKPAGLAAAPTANKYTSKPQLRPWLTVQPDVQYVIHPGGTRATRNAVVPGLRVAVSH